MLPACSNVSQTMDCGGFQKVFNIFHSGLNMIVATNLNEGAQQCSFLWPSLLLFDFLFSLFMGFFYTTLLLFNLTIWTKLLLTFDIFVQESHFHISSPCSSAHSGIVSWYFLIVKALVEVFSGHCDILQMFAECSTENIFIKSCRLWWLWILWGCVATNSEAIFKVKWAELT